MKVSTDNVSFTTYSSNEWIVNQTDNSNTEPEESLQAVAQDVYFALNTERYKYPIMGSNFGVTLDDLVGTDYGYIKSEIVRRVRDALSIDDRIQSVSDFVFTKTDADSLKVEFNVVSTYGTITTGLTVEA